MGLYLCIFQAGQEVAGVDCGSYSEYGHFIDSVVELEGGVPGARFPTLTLHSDCDGIWTVADCTQLRQDLAAIAAAFEAMPQILITNSKLGDEKNPTKNLLECFIDANGKPLAIAILELCELACTIGEPILFQ
jgi:hypothetical protein